MLEEVRQLVAQEIVNYFKNGLSIQFKRTSVKGRIPPITILRDGEPAINLVDKRLFVRTGADKVEQINTFMDTFEFAEEVMTPVILHNRGTTNFTYQVMKNDGTLVWAGRTILSPDSFQIDFAAPVKDFKVHVVFS